VTAHLQCNIIIVTDNLICLRLATRIVFPWKNNSCSQSQALFNTFGEFKQFSKTSVSGVECKKLVASRKTDKVICNYDYITLYLYFRGFTITLRHTTVGRTPLNKGSTRRSNLYLTHNTHKKHSCHLAGFEPAVPASERPQTHA
jgi:hypothetical protein